MPSKAIGVAKRKRPCKFAVANHSERSMSFADLPFVGGDGIEQRAVHDGGGGKGQSLRHAQLGGVQCWAGERAARRVEDALDVGGRERLRRL